MTFISHSLARSLAYPLRNLKLLFYWLMNENNVADWLLRLKWQIFWQSLFYTLCMVAKRLAWSSKWCISVHSCHVWHLHSIRGNEALFYQIIRKILNICLHPRIYVFICVKCDRCFCYFAADIVSNNISQSTISGYCDFYAESNRWTQYTYTLIFVSCRFYIKK